MQTNPPGLGRHRGKQRQTSEAPQGYGSGRLRAELFQIAPAGRSGNQRRRNLSGVYLVTKIFPPDEIVVRALHTTQGDGSDVYSFFIRGSDIVRVANISRINRDENEMLKGFQRPEIRSHVKGIVDYLNQEMSYFLTRSSCRCRRR